MDVGRERVILAGGAGLVGQNLVVRLKERGYRDLVVIDKHEGNCAIMRSLHPDVDVVIADLAEPGPWSARFERASAVVVLQAQIGALAREPFVRNNVIATQNVVKAVKECRVPYVLHVSSTVVGSVARDDYSDTKREQERIIRTAGVDCIILRPTLMFGWFDRKHLGWLSRFMRRSPIFPVPGDGRFVRQPLYVGDFCNVVMHCLRSKTSGSVCNIIGLERIYYIDLIRSIKSATRARCAIVNVPYGVFALLLRIYALFSRNPPFTVDQLAALTAGDEFEPTDWPAAFDVQPTSFESAIGETFNDARYSAITLKF